MKQPTREELDQLAQQINDWPFVAIPRECQEHIRDLLRSYPLPPEDGERAEVARELATTVYAFLEPHGRLVAHVRRSLDARSIVMRAAALLRQPPPPPAAGVSKETVLSLVQRFGSEAMTDAPAPGLRPMTGYDFTQAVGHLVSDIEALPDAAPREETRG